jgi:hypothetical protein
MVNVMNLQLVYLFSVQPTILDSSYNYFCVEGRERGFEKLQNKACLYRAKHFKLLNLNFPFSNELR